MEVKKIQVDGVVVTIPAGAKAYLIEEIPAYPPKKIIPFEKVTPEELKAFLTPKKIGEVIG